MKTNDVVKLRENLLNIMDEIHRVCDENNIEYYMIGGTAIGAIRHKGFIPWDTDIDIAMKRGDYNKFLEIANGKLANGFFCANYTNSKEWYRPHAVVFKMDTMIHWNRLQFKKVVDCPIYIDIMPLDNVPETENLRKIQENKIKKMRRLQKRRECNLFTVNTPFVCLIKRGLSFLLHLVESNEHFNRKLDNEMSKYMNVNSGNICSMASHYSYSKQSMDKQIYGKPTLYEFEGREYYGPEKMHDYLTKIFGDYMKLPPEDKRTEYLDHIECIKF